LVLVLAVTTTGACSGGGGGNKVKTADTTVAAGTPDTTGTTDTTGTSSPTSGSTVPGGHGTIATTTTTAPGSGTTVARPRPNTCGVAPAGPGATGKKQQAIVFANLGTIYHPAIRVPLAACATSGLPVQYVVSAQASPGDCTIDAVARVVMVNGPTCTVTARQPGNAEYDAAPPVSRVVNKGNQQVELVWVSKLETSYKPGKITVVLGVRSASPVTAQVSIAAGPYNVCSSAPQAIENLTNPDLKFDITLNDQPTGSADCTLEPNIGAQFIGAAADPRTYHISGRK
jgi:hypothetical protein